MVAVDRINNPKHPNNGKWYVSVSHGINKPMETVFIGSKKECVLYAKRISDSIYISNGIDYGAKW